LGYIKSEREERRRGENQSVRGANSSESEKERFWCVKEGRERRIRVVLLAKGKGVQGEWESQFGARIPG